MPWVGLVFTLVVGAMVGRLVVVVVVVDLVGAGVRRLVDALVGDRVGLLVVVVDDEQALPAPLNWVWHPEAQWAELVPQYPYLEQQYPAKHDP